MKTSDFDYHLPLELIAQTPVEPRDQSRLMVLCRSGSSIEHHCFYEIGNYLHSGDTIVLNNSRVIPARILGQKGKNYTTVEILLLRRVDNDVWETLVRPSKKVTRGTKIKILSKSDVVYGEINVEVLEQGEDGVRLIRFPDEQLLEKCGRVPLPPYIHTPLADAQRYQTVYAEINGSVAAPTAGFHFTPKLLDELQKKGVQLAFVTLHIGLDTFRPVRTDNPVQHKIHKEYGELTPEVTNLLNQTRKQGKKILAVGTSTVRLLEAAALSGTIQPFSGWVDLFILPGHEFNITDAMVTNFHLPRS
ncbi:MAG: tRNA preQ1(34) S-adenosylmethionine ribosyltransferase-isomerase QueA, partial [Chloroflexota bacterium]